MNFTKIKAAAKLATSQKLLKVKKQSPAILMTTGIVGLVGTIVLSSRATLKLEGVMDQHDEKVLDVKQARNKVIETDNGDEVIVNGKTITYSQEDYQRDLVIIHARTATKLIKLYAPAAALGVASIACIVTGHKVLDRRNVAVMAAYSTLEAGFDKYRQRVREEFGDEKDREFRRPRQILVESENAETGEVTQTFRLDEDGLSVYAQWFDISNKNWVGRIDHDMVFLRSQQNYMNDRLHAYGHVFLNEVHDALGIPRTQEGSVVGWVKGDGDQFVDFFSNTTDERGPITESEGGEVTGILLDFNVAGTIWNKI